MTDKSDEQESSFTAEKESAPAAQGKSGLATLASDNFSVIQSVGGVRGIIESLLPELAFLILFIVTHDLQLTIIISLVICAVEFIARLVQRQTITGVILGTVMVLICLFAAYRSNDARNYYLPACIINAVWGLVLGISLIARRPGIGYFVELIANPPTEDLNKWYHNWYDDENLRRAYTKATWLWVLMFIIRDAVQVPLLLFGNVYALGIATLVLGIPLFALVCWFSYLIIAGPRHEHKLRMQAVQAQEENKSASE